jgi:hypothetical protein
VFVLGAPGVGLAPGDPYLGGHPTFAGASCTVLEAFFNNDAVMSSSGHATDVERIVRRLCVQEVRRNTDHDLASSPAGDRFAVFGRRPACPACLSRPTSFTRT